VKAKKAGTFNPIPPFSLFFILFVSLKDMPVKPGIPHPKAFVALIGF